MTFVTLRIRHRWTSNTGRPVTRMRFRAVDITTLGSPNVCNGCQQAEVRVRTSGHEPNLLVSGGEVASTQGLTLELPVGGSNGSLNSSPSVALNAPLSTCYSVNVNFLLGVERRGIYRFNVYVEVLNGAADVQELGRGRRGGCVFKPTGSKSARITLTVAHRKTGGPPAQTWN